MSVSNIIIIVMFLFYSIVAINGTSDNMSIVYSLGAVEKYSVVGLFEGYRIFVATFINKSFVNLLASSLVLYNIGNLIELNFGKLKLIITFLLSAVFCNTMYLVLGNDIFCGTYGGAFALIASYIMLITKDKSYYTKTSINIIIIFIFAGIYLAFFDTTANVLISSIGFFIGIILNIDILTKSNTK